MDPVEATTQRGQAGTTEELMGGLRASDLIGLLRASAAISWSGQPIETCMQAAVDLTCGYTGWAIGHVFVLDAHAERLVSSGVWHISDERFRPFKDTTETMTFERGVGLPGRILRSQGSTWIRDVRTDPTFMRAEAATACGLVTGLGFPIVSPLGVEGVLEFFAASPVDPDGPLLDLLGHIGMQLGTAIDQKRAQDALAASEIRLAEAQHLARIGAFRYFADTDLLWWSPELCAIYGFDAASAPATLEECLSRVHPEDVERVRSSIENALETGEPFEHEYRLQVPDGSFRWAHTKGQVLAGVRLELAGYCQDLTERKAIEEELLTSRHHLEEAQRLARIGSWRWDVASNTVSWSDQLFRIYGLDPETSPATFEAYLTNVHDDDRARVRAAVERTVDTGEPFEHDYRIVRPNGEIRAVHARGEVVESVDGVPMRLSGYCHDVTERRRVDEALLRAAENELRMAEREHEVLEKLHEIERTKNAMLIGVSHEIRTPLTVIKGIAHTLQRADVRTSEHSADLLARLEANVERLDETLRDLLDLDRLSRGVVEPSPRPTQIFGLVARVVETHLGERRFHTEVEDFVADVDPGLVERIVENLVTNAVRYAGPDAEIWVKAMPTQEGTLIAVEDAGVGVPDEAKEPIFEPFEHRSDSPSPGAGVGLSLVARFAELHGGRAWVEDRDGGGASFRVLLPNLPVTHG